MTKTQELPSDDDELWVRRWLAKTCFVFGLALGFLIGFVVTLKLVQP